MTSIKILKYKDIKEVPASAWTPELVGFWRPHLTVWTDD